MSIIANERREEQPLRHDRQCDPRDATEKQAALVNVPSVFQESECFSETSHRSLLNRKPARISYLEILFLLACSLK
jgi:hypothetical protein